MVFYRVAVLRRCLLYWKSEIREDTILRTYNIEDINSYLEEDILAAVASS